MSRPTVSVVVPIYNVELFLEECFLSIANQTYSNIEIILVDDGSTDGSSDIADELARSNKHTTVIHKENEGLSEARNVGLRVSKGKYVTFVDSDDTLHEEFIENLVALAEEYKADIVQGDNSRKIHEMGIGSGKLNILNGRSAFIKLLRFRIISPTAWGKLYRTSLFRENELEFPVGRLHEDTAILYKLIYFSSKVVCLSRTLYFYRLNTDSITTASYTNKHYESVTIYHKELINFIKEQKIAINFSDAHRHKSLRFLSILNKLALHGEKDSPIYKDFEKKYKSVYLKSRSVACYLGIIPVSAPCIFIYVRKVTPFIRKIIGKS